MNDIEKVKMVDFEAVKDIEEHYGEYVYKEDHDYKFYRNIKSNHIMYKNFKTHEGGTIIDFYVDIIGMNIRDTIKHILNNDSLKSYNKNIKRKEENKEEPIEKIDYNSFIRSNKNYNNFGSYRYLVKIRKIDEDIFRYMYDKELIFRDLRGYTSECDKSMKTDTTLTYFVFKDPFKGDITGLSGRENRDMMKFKKFYDKKKGKVKQGRPFTKNFPNCEWGFNILKGKPRRLMVFEAPIDLLSYLTIFKGNRELNNTLYVALCGNNKKLLKGVVDNIKDKGLESISVATDNDKWGDYFSNYIEEEYGNDYQIERESSLTGDWNNDLIEMENIKDN